MSIKPITNSSSKSNILSLDFGETKIGFAIGNNITKTTHPLKAIISSKKTERFKAIEELINEWSPGLIVIGLPLNENGTESRLTLLVKKFSKKLSVFEREFPFLRTRKFPFGGKQNKKT